MARGRDNRGLKPSVSPTPDAIHAAYVQGEAAVKVVFEAQAKRIRDLEARVQALEDQIVKHCACCQADSTGVEASTVEKRQVFDLPEVRLEVTSIGPKSKRVRCVGTSNRGEYPAGVMQPTQYGPRIRAQIVYMNVYQQALRGTPYSPPAIFAQLAK